MPLVRSGEGREFSASAPTIQVWLVQNLADSGDSAMSLLLMSEGATEYQGETVVDTTVNGYRVLPNAGGSTETAPTTGGRDNEVRIVLGMWCQIS